MLKISISKSLLFIFLFLVVVILLKLAIVQYTNFQESSENLSLGITEYKKGNYAKAVKILISHANKGEKIAQYLIARSYAFGEGLPQNRKLANQYFSQWESNDQNLSKTYLWIAQEMEKNQAQNTKNYLEALAWYFFAALKDNKHAQYQLIQAYKNGYHQLLDISETCSQFWFDLHKKESVKIKKREIPKDCIPNKNL